MGLRSGEYGGRNNTSQSDCAASNRSFDFLWLVGLVPKKKSLLLAQKSLNYRRIDKVMKSFFDIEVAPITISKLHDIKRLDNLYNYL